MTNYEMVQQFHRAFRLHSGKYPSLPSPDIQLLRERLIMEEVGEFLEGVSNADLPNIAKELADILYVVYGTADAYGIPIDKVFSEVHRSNMSKLDDQGRPILRDDGKVQKGPNYFEPDVESLLYEQARAT